VYDDGSTDSTVSIVNSIAKSDNRIKLITGKENKGVGFARNILLDACDTSVACWQDSDDLSNIHRIKLQMVEYEKGCPLVFSKYRIFRDQCGINIKELPEDVILKSNAKASALFKVDKDIRFIESKILGGEDVAWVAQMNKKYSLTSVSKILYYVRFHPNRIGWLKWRVKREKKENIQGKSFDQLMKEFGQKIK
jgi:glycosyltransferase involved in cell wall biosynthesis